MITQFRVQNYKSLRDVSLMLTPVHVLIGPNNSGKSSILEAIQALCRSVDYPLEQAFAGRWKGRELVWNGSANDNISFDAVVREGPGSFEYVLECNFLPSQTERAVRVASETYRVDSKLDLETEHQPPFTLPCSVASLTPTDGRASSSQIAAAARIHRSLRGVHYYRFDARLLSLPTAPDFNRRFRMDATGFGLALCLDDILGFDRERFADLESRLRGIFPEIKSIKLLPEPAFRAPQDHSASTPMLQMSDGKGIYFEMAHSASLVPASQASDGALLVLAYLAVLALPKPPHIVLFEEPENGIHPRRLNNIVGIFREIVSEHRDTQLILTTHSPYLLDLFNSEEVTVCTQKDGQAKTAGLSDSQIVRDQLDIFSLGEIWTAEGDDKLAGAVTTGDQQ